MRRWWVAVLTVMAVMLTACSGADDEPGTPSPEPSAQATTPPDGVPAATQTAREVAAAIVAADLAVDGIASAEAAQEDLDAILARMRGVRPDVTLEHISYGPGDDEATAHLN